MTGGLAMGGEGHPLAFVCENANLGGMQPGIPGWISCHGDCPV